MSCLAGLIIPASLEFDQTKSVTERIGHNGKAAPGVFLNVSLELGPGSLGFLHKFANVANDEIEVDRRIASRMNYEDEV
jgi:hypothetical protein